MLPPLRLYRHMLKASNSFADYNFRNYFYQHTRDSFRKIRDVKDKSAADDLLAKSHQTLGMLQRQSAISRMYASAECVMDTKRQRRPSAAA